MHEIIKADPEYRKALDDYLSSAGVPLLLFKMGAYVSGDDEIPIGTRFIAKPREHKVGWVRWADGKPAETVPGYLYLGFFMPQRDTLGFLDESQWPRDANGDPRDVWQTSESISFFADNGEEFNFPTGSYGGHYALAKLQKAYRLDGLERNDPVIELGSERKKNTKGDFYQRPVFNVLGWITQKANAVALPKLSAGEIVNDEIVNHPAPKIEPKQTSKKSGERPHGMMTSPFRLSDVTGGVIETPPVSIPSQGIIQCHPQP